MIKKRFLTFSALLSLIAVSTGVGIVTTSDSGVLAEEQLGDPNTVIDIANLNPGVNYIETTLGGTIAISYKDGIITNGTPIQNLKAIEVLGAKDDKKGDNYFIDYSFVGKTEFDKLLARKNQSFGKIYNFNNERPSFFTLRSNVEADITQVKLYYECDAINGSYSKIPGYYLRKTELIGSMNDWGKASDMRPYTFTFNNETIEDVLHVRLVRGNAFTIKSTYTNEKGELIEEYVENNYQYGDNSAFKKNDLYQDGNDVRVINTADYDIYYKGNKVAYIAEGKNKLAESNPVKVNIKLVNTDAEFTTIDPTLVGNFAIIGNKFSGEGNSWNQNNAKFKHDSFDNSYRISVSDVTNLQFKVINYTKNGVDWTNAVQDKFVKGIGNNFNAISEGRDINITIYLSFSKFGTELISTAPNFELA